MNEEQGKIEDYIFSELECTEGLTRDFIEKVLEDIKTFDSKQRDYGSKNISEFGEYGVLIRANDKIARLKNLLNNHSIAEPSNESIEDSWRDLSVYGIIARLCRKGVWPK